MHCSVIHNLSDPIQILKLLFPLYLGCDMLYIAVAFNTLINLPNYLFQNEH